MVRGQSRQKVSVLCLWGVITLPAISSAVSMTLCSRISEIPGILCSEHDPLFICSRCQNPAHSASCMYGAALRKTQRGPCNYWNDKIPKKQTNPRLGPHTHRDKPLPVCYCVNFWFWSNLASLSVRFDQPHRAPKKKEPLTRHSAIGLRNLKCCWSELVSLFVRLVNPHKQRRIFFVSSFTVVFRNYLVSSNTVQAVSQSDTVQPRLICTTFTHEP